MRRSTGRLGNAAILLALIAVPGVGQAQLIELKTVPVAAGDQFQMFPSRNLGMAGVSIALDDPWLDPFVNPARGARVEGGHVFLSPTFYSVSAENGAGRTLPAGALIRTGSWFGGVAVSIQQLELATAGFGLPFGRLDLQPGRPLDDLSPTNWYRFAMLGREIPGADLAVGVSVFWAELDAAQAVELLYAAASDIEQSGSMVDLRLGVHGELEGGREYDALLVHDRFDMRHEVTYLGPILWDPLGQPIVETRLERNLDRTRTWGLHLGYHAPLAEEGWRLGGILTANRKSHPKIPNYEIMNIPRDPGTSWAFDFGVGLSLQRGPVTFGLDLIYEPIWSDTWAEAETLTVSASGKTIPKGGRTVENDFRFSNGIIRTGVGWEQAPFGAQLGLHVRSIDYRLRQHDRVEETRRRQDESWTEWRPGLGLGLSFPDFEVRYAGSLTTGTGRPGIAWDWPAIAEDRALAEQDIIIAPAGPLTLQEQHVVSHQLYVIIPIGR